MKQVVSFLVLSVVLGMPCMADAHAQGYPVKPVRVVIPHGVGGSNDIVGRIVFARVSDVLGQQFVMENRVGAGSTIGEAHVASQPADGYTVMVHSTTIVANAYVHKGLSYDPKTAFAAITPLAAQVGILGIHPSLPVKSVKELIALARARPGQISYASAGSGSYTHMAGAYLNGMAGTKMLHIPYKGGTAAAIGMVTGEAQVYIATYALFKPFMDRKQVRLLGVVSDTRIRALPQLPTISEDGVPGYDFAAWVGVFVRAGTPRNLIDILHSALAKVMDMPDVQKRFDDLLLDPMFMIPEQFEKRIRADHVKYEKAVALANARVE